MTQLCTGKSLKVEESTTLADPDHPTEDLEQLQDTGVHHHQPDW